MGILNTIKNAFSGTKSKPTENIPPEQRELPPTFYLDTIEANRVEKDRYFQSSPYSPIEDRVDFTGLDYYPPDPAYRYTLPLKHADEPEPLTSAILILTFLLCKIRIRKASDYRNRVEIA